MDVNGIALEMARRGAGAPLLYLHPHIGLTRAEPFLDALAQHFAVMAPSHAGLRPHRAAARLHHRRRSRLFLSRSDRAARSRRSCWSARRSAAGSPRRSRPNPASASRKLVLADPVGIKSRSGDHRDIVDIFVTKQNELERWPFTIRRLALDHKAMWEEDAYSFPQSPVRGAVRLVALHVQPEAPRPPAPRPHADAGAVGRQRQDRAGLRPRLCRRAFRARSSS